MKENFIKTKPCPSCGESNCSQCNWETNQTLPTVTNRTQSRPLTTITNIHPTNPTTPNFFIDRNQAHSVHPSWIPA